MTRDVYPLNADFKEVTKSAKTYPAGIFGAAKGNTGIDRKPAHPLLFTNRCPLKLYKINVPHLGRADSISNPVFAFIQMFRLQSN